MKVILAGMGGASGSVGGNTYSHNRYGTYIRRRAIPTNPNSTYQQECRSNLGNLAAAWRDTLTAGQREGWTTYAANTPVKDVFGDNIYLTGLSMYVRCNTPRMQANRARIDTAPEIFGNAEYTAPVVSASEATQLLSVAFTNTDDWAGEVGGCMFICCSRPKSPTINFFKGPYRYAGEVAGAVVPPASPQTMAAPFAFTAAQKLFVKVLVTRADGRISEVWRGFCTAGA